MVDQAKFHTKNAEHFTPITTIFKNGFVGMIKSDQKVK